jgi:hypothetical protein
VHKHRHRRIRIFLQQNANALVSGALAGFTCDLCVHPIDTVRTRLILESGQSQYKNTFHAFQSILSKEGVRALYRGAGIVWTFTIPGSTCCVSARSSGFCLTIFQCLPVVEISGHAVYFTTYETAKKKLEKVNDPRIPTHFVSGFVAELMGALIWCPMVRRRRRRRIGGLTRFFFLVASSCWRP